MQFPTGVSDFQTLIKYRSPLTNERYLYVDKSLFIKEILEDGTPVIIITRPRRFGKTLNLSMLQYFFAVEVERQSTKGIFDNLEISNDPICMEHQGKYPVVFISFKDVKQPNFAFCIEKIGSIIAAVYEKYEKELQSDKMSESDKVYIKAILEQKISQVKLESAIYKLLGFLFKYYNTKPILLIDEYDTPIQEAYLNDYYDQLIPFFRNFLSEPLKDYNLLNRAVLTGILRVSKESLFSGLSNIEIYSILHQKYSNYFGFLEEETNELLVKANMSENLKQTKQWYNGYIFGGTTIYNPWSIIKFIKSGGDIAPYWINTSGNELIRDLLIESDFKTTEKISQLIAGDTIKETIDEHIVFKDLERNQTAIWSLFLMTGYLKAMKVNMNADGDKECEIAVPNKEIESLYKRIVREWLSGSRGIVWYQDLWSGLTNGKAKEFENSLQEILISMASYYDTGEKTQEIFYQGLMLGIVCGLKDNYEIRANRESGVGRYDLALIPKDPKNFGIVMEFKAINDQLNLINEAKKALNQIKKLRYDTELRSRGIANIYFMGIAFSGKAVKVVADN
jgi:hypothetical protein